MVGVDLQLAKCANLVVWFESVAQLVEHRPFKALVLGSSPSALTIKSIIYKRFLKWVASPSLQVCTQIISVLQNCICMQDAAWPRID